MNYIPASKESIQSIQIMYDNMGNNFSLFTPMLCNCVSSLEHLDQVIINELDKENKAAELKLLETILKIQTFTLQINLDLSTFLRANYRTNLISEKRFNLKYINILTFEGYNYLFGFKKTKKNAIWASLKKLAEQINDIELISDINNLKKAAQKFEVLLDKSNRNLAIHYDLDPFKTYANILGIKENDEIKRTNSFLEILENLSIFINKYIIKFQTPSLYSKSNLNITILEKINYFSDHGNKILNMLENNIISFSNSLDNVIKLCNKPEKIASNFNFNSEFSEKFKPLIRSIYPGIHMHFIYLDLACATRAYLSSEYYIEKQINLMRINIIVYEGFNKIYGYNEKEQLQSFWHKSICSVLNDSTDKNIINSLKVVKITLKELAIDDNINNMQLRNYFVHYRYKNIDYIINRFNELAEANPFVEINKSLKLLKLLPDLMKLNTDSMNVTHQTESVKIQSSNNEMLVKLNDLILKTNNFNMNTEDKKKVIGNITKMKKMLTP